MRTHSLCGAAGLFAALLVGSSVAFAQDLSTSEASTDLGVIVAALVGGGGGTWIVRALLTTLERVATHAVDKAGEAVKDLTNITVKVHHIQTVEIEEDSK